MIDDLKRIGNNAYAAGILDGEGCISIRHDKRKERPEHTYTPRITVVNTNPQVIEWFRETFGGCVSMDKSCKSKGWKDKYIWILNSPEEVQLFIEKVYKYLIIKKKQAQVVMWFINRIYPDRGERWFIEMGMLNSGGRGLTEEQKSGFIQNAGTPTNRITKEMSA